MERIKISTIQHMNEYFQFSASFNLDIPAKFSSLPNKTLIAQSYNYNIIAIEGVDYFNFVVNYSFANTTTNTEVKSELELEYFNSQTKLNNFQLESYDVLSGDYYDGVNWSL